VRRPHLRQLFAGDLRRAERLTAEVAATTPELEGADEPSLHHDSSTNALIRRYRRLKIGRS
jgi:hypothetical protein